MPKHIIITINEYDFVSSFPTFLFWTHYNLWHIKIFSDFLNFATFPLKYFLNILYLCFFLLVLATILSSYIRTVSTTMYFYT